MGYALAPTSRAASPISSLLDVWTDSDENERCFAVQPGIQWAVQRHLTAASSLAAEELLGEN
jgi:hypothetical protein